MKIEMIGYNDTKAIGLYSIIKITPFVFSSFFISIIISIPAFIFKIYDLLFVFLLPLFLIFIMVMQYLINITNKNFLKDKRIKHKIVLEDGILYKDEKEIKSIANIRLYKFKKILFLELKNSYYRIMNKDFIQGLCPIGRTKTKSGRAETDKLKLNRKRVINYLKKWRQNASKQNKKMIFICFT